MSLHIHDVKRQFEHRFGHAAEVVVRAPGRVNIIGEHTDYNHGFVLPMAIEHETVIAARRRADRRLHAFAANLDRCIEADLDHRARNADEPWIDYVVGVADEVAALGLPLIGAELLIAGDVPIACGLSSSASLEMAALCMFEALGGFRVEGAEAPRLGQRVENRFLGLSSGIMDQFISRMGRKGHALFLDCRSFAYELVPVAFASATFVIANTGVARGLTSSKYNERVAQCREAVAGMAKTLNRPGTHLRDFNEDELTACRGVLSDIVFRRARHVISENARTQAACAVLRAGDAVRLGELMNASDESLRDDYEVTCPELDAMTAIARGLPGCHGARMTGAGFGGCTICLVETDAAPAFCERLIADYRQRTGLQGQTFLSSPADGASRVE
ncbi:MAG TPA: galactokinase [Candidatus Hydrogenedentes bacterium]|nr:galactokinase [Candidatus Hydrogenedentota bacterium]